MQQIHLKEERGYEMIFVNIYGLKNIIRAIKKHSFGIGGGRWYIVRFSKAFLWKRVTEREIYQIYTYISFFQLRWISSFG